ncbi:OLC1v1012277C1 [Oldenlandia corymbosa var. corymbosa]|uniref:OLC1v1012277C1 n=1 Tax=Oldenlandia corymbosa var. corymbosa TaxID=529605 RepID=A0AAV1DVM0_OLDCO|nr:OLC1v1012277C1 [Oldenlandia corymbosa var. corymbosa]
MYWATDGGDGGGLRLNYFCSTLHRQSKVSTEGFSQLSRSRKLESYNVWAELTTEVINGIVCVYEPDSGLSFRCTIYNVSTGQGMRVPDPTLHSYFDRLKSFHLGYDATSKMYKLLRFVYTNQLQAEIMTLRPSNMLSIWRKLDTDTCGISDFVAADVSSLRDGLQSGDGFLWWLTKREYLISFDLSNEKFKWVQLPEDVRGAFRSDVFSTQSMGRPAIWVIPDADDSRYFVLFVFENCESNTWSKHFVQFPEELGPVNYWICNVGNLPTGEILLMNTREKYQDYSKPVYSYDHHTRKFDRYSVGKLPDNNPPMFLRGHLAGFELSCSAFPVAVLPQRPAQRFLRASLFKFYSTCYVSTQISIPDPPSSAHYDQLINEAGRAGDFGAVRILLMKRFRDGGFNTSKTFKFISSDLTALDDLLHSLAGLNNGFLKKSSHDSLIMRLSKLHRIPEALHVAEVMVRNNYGPNACTFHPILICLTKKKEMDKAWRILEVMKEYKIAPDLTAYNYLLTAYCHSGNITSAAYVLTKMEEGKLGADTRTYDALVLGACRAGKIDGALMLLRRMVDEGTSPLYSTHTHVINAMVRNGYCSQAMDFVMSFAGKDKELDSENFGVLATRLIRLEKLEEAKFILKEMKRRGINTGNKLKDFYYFHAPND